VCAQCHSRRAQIAEGYQAGRPFLDHYLPALLTPGLYHADGQQRDEVYIWASWLQSRMHRAGVTCSDCHDPHTQKLRAPGNAVCAQCHIASKYDAPEHHHHKTGSAGASCADCHMPRTTYMVVDPRRDHSLRVPRPDESVALGVPNACNMCHKDRDAKWAAAAVRSWYGRDAVGMQSFAAAFHAAEAGEPGSSDELSMLAFDAAQPPIVRASALERLAASGRFDPGLVGRASQDSAALVRLASARLADALPLDARPAALGQLLRDDHRAVRIEAARALAGAQRALPADLQPAWQAAADEYLATLRYNADRPESNVALGGFHGALGRLDEAQEAFANAMKLDPGFVPAYVNAADAMRALGRDAEAAGMLEQGIARVPNSAALHHALGLTRVRLQQTDAAVQSLRRAVQLEPGSARYTYVYGVALHSSGHPEEAIRTLERAVQRWPHDRDILVALASFQRDAGRLDAARDVTRRLVADYPSDPDAQALAVQLQVMPGER
jgi:predicted CXXCH cytochrome family protein